MVLPPSYAASSGLLVIVICRTASGSAGASDPASSRSAGSQRGFARPCDCHPVDARPDAVQADRIRPGAASPNGHREFSAWAKSIQIVCDIDMKTTSGSPHRAPWLARIYQVVRGTAQLGVGAGVPDQSRDGPTSLPRSTGDLQDLPRGDGLHGAALRSGFPAQRTGRRALASSLCRPGRSAGPPGDDRWTEAVDRLQTEMGPRRDRAATVDNEVHSAGSKQGISHNVIEAPRAIIERPITRHEPTSGCTSPRWPPLDGAVYRYRPTGEWSWAIRGDFLAPDR